ncbi:hypothetical protein ACIQAC_34205 [Streptomyces sp. NPDC088387]|uniref:hypothetical protein n=1 Tax=Streptomyces sp. NPDC088387 TaxID=3365859 RepID=UPI0037FDCE86
MSINLGDAYRQTGDFDKDGIDQMLEQLNLTDEREALEGDRKVVASLADAPTPQAPLQGTGNSRQLRPSP